MNPATPTLLDLLRSAGTITAILAAFGGLAGFLVVRRRSSPPSITDE